MASSALHGASGLGISCSSQEPESSRIEFDTGTVKKQNQYPKYPISTEESEPLSNSESSQPGYRGRVGLSDAFPEKCRKLSKSSDSIHTGLTIDNFEKGWKDSEIDTILGDANSRLKSGAKLLPLDPGQQKNVSLEKSKRRTRVDVNIFLRNDICVENGYLQGLVRLHIRKPPKKSQSILLSGGKVRIVGFESTTKEEARSAFYQFCANISDVASGLDAVYSSIPDAEGFMEVKQGIHLLPFSLQLASSQARGKPKGSMQTQSGISVRYIAMVIKDATSGKLSIAHFYRDCNIWPRLNPTTVLSSTSRPIQVTVSSGITMGGSGKINLTASLHRLHWIAGQLCHVKFDIVNHSNKTLKLLSLELLQTITTFRVKNTPLNEEEKENPITSTTSQKLVAQSSLTIGERGSRGHASAKGWWMGVVAGTSQTFSHSILLPTYALSISRGKLLEVSYNLRATIGPGSFLSTDINVSIPLEIINILSIDPPHQIAADLVPGCSASGECRNKDLRSYDGPLMDDDETDSTESEADQAFEYDLDPLGNLSMHDDADDLVNHIVSSSNLEGANASRFADLYYSLPDENPNKDSQAHSSKPVGTITSDSSKSPNINSTTQHQEPKKLPNFPVRIVEKMEKRKNPSDKAGNIIQNPIQKEGSDCGLTIAEQIFGSPRRDVSHRDSLNAGYTTSGSTNILTKLPNHNEITNATPTEKSILNGPLTDSPSAIGSREVSINDIINAYTQIVHDKTDRSTASPQQEFQRKPDPGSHTTMSFLTNQNNSDPVTHSRGQVSIDVAAFRPRSKSVKDKIRDLEELAAKANT